MSLLVGIYPATCWPVPCSSRVRRLAPSSTP